MTIITITQSEPTGVLHIKEGFVNTYWDYEFRMVMSYCDITIEVEGTVWVLESHPVYFLDKVVFWDMYYEGEWHGSRNSMRQCFEYIKGNIR